MISEIRIRSFQKYKGLFILGIMIAGMAICAIPVVADEGGFPTLHGGIPVVADGGGFPTLHGGIPSGYMDFSYWNPYAGWDNDLLSTAGFGLYTPDIGFLEEETEALPLADPTVDHWVKFSYFPAGSAPGQPAILSGYVGGRNFNAEVTIAGKKESNDVFHKIITIKPQENGVFVWAIPDDLVIVQFYRATASVGGMLAKSEIVSTSLVAQEKIVSSEPSSAFATDSIVSSSVNQVASATNAPVAASTSAPVTNAAAPASTSSSLPVITALTLSASNLRPAVGQEVTLSGVLTGNGKGVPGATISIEVPDYGTDFLPLVSTKTDSNGRYTATINTWEGGRVPVRAVFAGDDKYQAATSSTLTFTAGTG